MTEQEYIDATNLAKIRSARAILRDVLPMIPEHEKILSEAMSATYRLETIYARLARITP